MVWILLGFLLISGMGYALLRHSITTNYEKDTMILFYEVRIPANELLSHLMHLYIQEKNTLLKKHAQVLRYIQNQTQKPLDIDLKEIHKTINQGHVDWPYHIYLTDKDLVIRNTTFKKDLGFDLSFALPAFTAHYQADEIGVSSPIVEETTQEFFSYTDGYLSRDKEALLQVSYSYKAIQKKFHALMQTVNQYPNIIEAKVHMLSNANLATEISLKNIPAYKPNALELLIRSKRGFEVSQKLKEHDLLVETFKEGGTSYKIMLMSSDSSITDESKMVFSFTLDETALQDKLQNLNLTVVLLVFLAIVAFLIMVRMRKKEIKLSEQDKFIQSSMHEIKTPLSIITLNNELRTLEFGSDEYSLEIDSAIKLLKVSYDDMSFRITKDRVCYIPERFSLGEVLTERVQYFKTIAKSDNKAIELNISGDSTVTMSLIELSRLIDNNLSNAIKYSTPNTCITVTLEENVVSFHNQGTPIIEAKKIFDKYYRENTIVGGHGLGLSIVKEVADKYHVAIKIDSNEISGTTFSYAFKCHTDDIPKV